jgi:hypothetical protein
MRVKLERPMTKSPLAVAKTAYALARAALPKYSSPVSRHDYTQPQLFAILTLKSFFRTDYRGIVAILADWPALRKAIGLRHLPHHTTLYYAAGRQLKKGDSKPWNELVLDTPSSSVS